MGSLHQINGGVRGGESPQDEVALTTKLIIDKLFSHIKQLLVEYEKHKPAAEELKTESPSQAPTVPLATGHETMIREEIQASINNLILQEEAGRRRHRQIEERKSNSLFFRLWCRI